MRRTCAISFRETGLDTLLAYNMDQGRILYKSVAQLHRDHRKPALPIDLGELQPFPKPTKPKPRRPATATIA